jgi:hypothetical protein
MGIIVYETYGLKFAQIADITELKNLILWQIIA